ncbi:MAG: TolC family protein, partial [Gemmatimonadaceae bacterium]
AGIQLQWNPFNWGITSRDRQVSHLQQQIVDTEEEAFAASIQRSVEQDIASIDRIEATLVDDDRIIELRADILRETQARYSEGVVTAAEYVDRQTDLLAARVSRSIHRVELSQARAHFLTALGLEVR